MNKIATVLVVLLLGFLAAVLLLEFYGNQDTRYFPYGEIARLEASIESLNETLATLPEQHSRWVGERFGYHSPFTPFTGVDTPLPEWVELELNRESPIIAVALAPAVNPEGDRRETYGFPKRFKIEFRLDRDEPPVYVIDCTQKDFPDPGIAPVIFENLNFEAKYMRILVPRGQVVKGMEFFALSEVYVIERRSVGVDNIAPYSGLYTSRYFESYPYWHLRFISDRNGSLGLPLGIGQKPNTDFIGEFVAKVDDDQVQIVFDLGEERTLGRATFYPASPRTGVTLPHFGYPNEIYIEVFNDAELKEPLYRMDVIPDYRVRGHRSHVFYRPLTDMFFAVPLEDAKGRYVRITTSGLLNYENNAILAFGEIILFSGDQNLSNGCKVEIRTDMTPVGEMYPDRIVDGYANSYEVIDTYDWLKGLEQRYKLERDLAQKQNRLAVLEERIDKSWKTVAIVVSLIILVVATVIITMLKLASIRSVRLIREQISRDLHDDIGCNIGTLSLGIGNLQEELDGSEFAGEIRDLHIVTQETAAALEEVVYFTNRETVFLDELAARLNERARIILGEMMEVKFSIPEPLPQIPVDFVIRRNVFLFFKEALHNCAKHSDATQVSIVLEMKGREFSVRVSDNGTGFYKENLSRVSGLYNMSARAKKVGGRLTVESAPGKGTTLCFTLTIPHGRK